VTDNKGATGSATRSVTVTSGTTTPPATGVIATDTFARTVAGGWGTADVGGAWTPNGSASNLSAGSGAGSIRLSGPSAQAGAYLGSVSQTSVDLTGQVSLDTAASGGGTQISLQGRRVGSSDYRATIALKAGGSATVSLVGAGTTLTSATVPGTVAANTLLSFRLQVTGTDPTTVRAKVWLSTSAEPSTWTVSATSTTAALQAAGGLGIVAYVSGSAAAGVQTVALRGLKAVAL
jgi:hypothetical protein